MVRLADHHLDAWHARITREIQAVLHGADARVRESARKQAAQRLARRQAIADAVRALEAERAEQEARKTAQGLSALREEARQLDEARERGRALLNAMTRYRLERYVLDLIADAGLDSTLARTLRRHLDAGTAATCPFLQLHADQNPPPTPPAPRTRPRRRVPTAVR